MDSKISNFPVINQHKAKLLMINTITLLEVELSVGQVGGRHQQYA